MGWLKKSENTASIAVQPSPSSARPTIHNHTSQPSRATEILAYGVLGIICVWLAWHGGVYILDRAGFRDAERAMAEGLLFLAGLGCVAILSSFLGRYIIAQILTARIELERVRQDGITIRLQYAQQLPPATLSQMSSEDSRFFMAVKMTMIDAYERRLDADGNLTGGQSQPWSRRGVGALRLWNEDKPIGEQSNIAGRVKRWLLASGVLINDTRVNLAEYPNLASVEAALVGEFGRPIVYNGNRADVGLSARYEHI